MAAPAAATTVSARSAVAAASSSTLAATIAARFATVLAMVAARFAAFTRPALVAAFGELAALAGLGTL